MENMRAFDFVRSQMFHGSTVFELKNFVQNGLAIREGPVIEMPSFGNNGESISAHLEVNPHWKNVDGIPEVVATVTFPKQILKLKKYATDFMYFLYSTKGVQITNEVLDHYIYTDTKVEKPIDRINCYLMDRSDFLDYLENDSIYLMVSMFITPLQVDLHNLTVNGCFEKEGWEEDEIKILTQSKSVKAPYHQLLAHINPKYSKIDHSKIKTVDLRDQNGERYSYDMVDKLCNLYKLNAEFGFNATLGENKLFYIMHDLDVDIYPFIEHIQYLPMALELYEMDPKENPLIFRHLNLKESFDFFESLKDKPNYSSK